MKSIRTILAVVVFALGIAAVARAYTLANATGQGLATRLDVWNVVVTVQMVMAFAIGAVILSVCVLLFDHAYPEVEREEEGSSEPSSAR